MLAPDFDVVVIGGGVGGGCAALALRQRGLRVALLESGAVGRHKVCGEFLSPESRQTFTRLGVLDDLLNAGARQVSAARILTSRRIGHTMPLPEAGLAISRIRLDSLLWGAAQKAGVVTHQETRVTHIQPSDKGYYLQTGAGEIATRFVVCATGRNARLHMDGNETPKELKPQARFMGIKTHLRGTDCPPGEVRLFPFRGGYCGLAQVEDGSANACALVAYDESRGHSPAEIWEAMGEQNTALKAATCEASLDYEWVATGNVSFESLHPVRDGLVCVGDAAGYIHPLTGDGMAMAARSGELAAAAMEDSSCFTTRYQQLWHSEFARRLRVAAFLQPLFTNPLLTTAALATLDVMPGLARHFVRVSRGY